MGSVQKIIGYEQIAAGEVVERPASIVKELLENAIDAGATRIHVHVEQAGKKLIKVTDNGAGIPREDVVVAFEKHTSSKIIAFEDVYNLKTLGFRGEALASIKAVARVEMITKPEGQELGTRVVFENNQLVKEEEIACPTGTTVMVTDLFRNVPVRRKFLKSDAVEFSHISDIVTRYALASHERDIKLFHNGRLVLDAPPSNGNLLNTIVSIYGRDHSRNMLRVEETRDYFSVSGYIANPEITRSSRRYSSIFVNNRYVLAGQLARAIEDAYHGRLMKNRYPFYVLFLEIDPGRVDVNIHPAKREIKFQDEEDLFVALRDIIAATLEGAAGKNDQKAVQSTLAPGLRPSGELTGEPRGQDSESGGGTWSSTSASRVGGSRFQGLESPGHTRFDALIEKAADKVPRELKEWDRGFDAALDSTSAKLTPGADRSSVGMGARDRGGADGARGPGKEDTTSRVSGWRPLLPGLGDTGETSTRFDTGSFQNIPAVRTLRGGGMQLGGTFLLFEAMDGSGDLIIVDQHAASERVQYESIKRSYEENSITSQEMLIPRTISLAPSLVPILESYLDELERFGFKFIKDKENEMEVFKLKGFPFISGRRLDVQHLESFLEEILSGGADAARRSHDDILKSLGCHSAIKSGDPLTPGQAWKLLKALDSCSDPFHCAHGRPTILRKSFSWLEREFKRIV